MRPFSRITPLFSSLYPSSRVSSPLFLQISNFSVSENPPSSSNTVTPLRRHEEESRNVRVSVWWDFENCGIPAGANVFKVAHNISSAVRANGIKGSIQITAFGDMMQLSKFNQEALSATGIGLTHIPSGGKNSADRSLFIDLMDWVSENPPPAHLFLISGDGDFANILHRLRMNNYNILLASRGAPEFLASAATIVWNWLLLVKGQGLAGEQFNRPPDGPQGSWYGHCKAQKKDSFDSGSDPKVGLSPVPREVLTQHIQNILYSHPEGISVAELWSEIQKSGVTPDKNFYGHKKFYCFLLSIRYVLELEEVSSGRHLVRGITRETIMHADQRKREDRKITTMETSDTDKYTTNVVGTKKLSLMSEEGVEETSPEVQEPSQTGKKIAEMADEQINDCLDSSVDRQDYMPEAQRALSPP